MKATLEPFGLVIRFPEAPHELVQSQLRNYGFRFIAADKVWLRTSTMHGEAVVAAIRRMHEKLSTPCTTTD